MTAQRHLLAAKEFAPISESSDKKCPVSKSRGVSSSLAMDMRANLVSEERKPESPIETLGDLLYADALRSRIPEQEWASLVQRIAAADQHALHELSRRMYGIVFTALMGICKHHATAESLTLEVFHDIWCKASAYDAAGSSVVGWIMNLARARALERLESVQAEGVDSR